LKDLKKIDAQETEEQLEHHEVKRVGSKGPSKFWQSDPDSHRSKDDQQKKEIIFSKHFGFPVKWKIYRFEILASFIRVSQEEFYRSSLLGLSSLCLPLSS